MAESKPRSSEGAGLMADTVQRLTSLYVRLDRIDEDGLGVRARLTVEPTYGEVMRPIPGMPMYLRPGEDLTITVLPGTGEPGEVKVSD